MKTIPISFYKEKMKRNTRNEMWLPNILLNVNVQCKKLGTENESIVHPFYVNGWYT